MGPKITIDSATMMNKALEIVEARWLFNVRPDQIEVVIHPESVIHSLVEFCDGSLVAQLGTPDMRGPIGYALGYPARLPLRMPKLSFTELTQLTFEAPDVERFPCVKLAYDALRAGGTAPAVLNAANEVAVAAFLADKIRFAGIPEVIERTLEAHSPGAADGLEPIVAADEWARDQAQTVVRALS
jgi:1-deoxy-D-xylulose-5-phosphate reductoisomerase